MKKDNFDELVHGYSLLMRILAKNEKEENLCELEEILHHLIVDEAKASSSIVQPYVGKPATIDDGYKTPINLTGSDPDKIAVRW